MNTKKLVIYVEDIHCASCSQIITDSLSKMGGVNKVNVYLVSKIVSIEYDTDAVTANRIIDRIKSLGYTPSIQIEEDVLNESFYDKKNNAEKNTLFLKFILSLVSVIILFYAKYFYINGLASFLIGIFIWAYCAGHYHKGFLYSIKNFTFDMNSLVSISTTVSLIFNSIAFFYPDAVNQMEPHWHELAMLIAFINFGRYLELFVREKATSTASAMLKMYPKFANVLKDGEIKRVSVENINIGDIIVIKKGEQIPCDSTVINGETYVDESTFTGESNPVFKKKGDILYATTINTHGFIEARVEKTAKDTLFMQIVGLVRDSQIKKTKVSNRVDRITKYFVPSILIISLFFAVFWYLHDGLNMALLALSSVLIVACPCAMGLSVPIALFIGFTRASKSGFIINNPDTINEIKDINLVIFDKTGTLTKGELEPVEIKSIMDKDKFLYILKSAFTKSSHILADNFVRYYKDIKPGDASDFNEIAGKGIVCKIDDKKAVIGNINFLKENGINIDNADEDYLLKSEFSYFALGFDNKFEGYVIMKDSLRENASEIINRFKQYGIKPVIASGDKKNIVQSIAKELGIDDYYYEVLPEEKHSIVLKYKMMGYKVMMIGDGLNDSAAISNSDIGIALKKGSDITATASDIILIKEDLSLIFKVIKLSKSIEKIIKENLFWAFGYNTILIPVAGGVLLLFGGPMMPPYLSAMAMSLSSISVVLNSMRLYRIKIDE
ncbi:MAG: cadmium-translocating P-type ATPase [Elusimicrobia bacterium]|nr:cadmium-translocating P-type ATPase [Elusimicrobiota bacterium]